MAGRLIRISRPGTGCQTIRQWRAVQNRFRVAWPGRDRVSGPDGVHGVVPFAVLFPASSCPAFPRGSTHLPFSLTRPPRGFCPGEWPSLSVRSGVDGHSWAWGWASGHSRRQAVPADRHRPGHSCLGLFLFQVFGHEDPARLSSSVFACTGRVSSPGPVISLRIPLPVASAHELGPRGPLCSVLQRPTPRSIRLTVVRIVSLPEVLHLKR